MKLPIDPERIARIRAMCRDGARTGDVARAVGVSMATVAKYREPPADNLSVPRSHLSAAERQEAVRLCGDGLPVVRIAEALKRDPRAVARAVDMAGAKRRRTIDRVSEAEVDYIRWAHARGDTCRAIAGHLDRDVLTIVRHATRMGLRFRRRGPPNRWLATEGRAA